MPIDASVILILILCRKCCDWCLLEVSACPNHHSSDFESEFGAAASSVSSYDSSSGTEKETEEFKFRKEEEKGRARETDGSFIFGGSRFVI